VSKYTNSPLASYIKIAPSSNHYGKRTHAIDTITIHCYVGQVTVERAGEGFANPGRRASCNYVVGRDGRIGLILPEEFASACTSSKANDERAVTIETACDSFHPYAVTGAAYSSLIELVADICRRNGIKRLLWRGNKSLIGQVDKQNMTVHRWFARKACPGDWLYERHGEIAAKVSEKLEEEEPVSYEQWKEFMDRYLKEQEELPASTWAKDILARAKLAGITDSTRPRSFATREEVTAMVAATKSKAPSV